MYVSPGVVLHEIGQLRQIFAWVSAINLTITTKGLVNQTRGSHLENIKTKRVQQLCIKPTGLLVRFWVNYLYLFSGIHLVAWCKIFSMSHGK